MADFEPGLHKGEVLTNDDIRQLFNCSSVGSMRRSLVTNSLLLVSGESAGPYHDRWEGEVFHFTGRGLRGDQDLDESQNRTLAESDVNGVAVFHFDNQEEDRFVFTGRMKLAGAPYTERQRDELDDERRVWMFPLTVMTEAVAAGVATSGASSGAGAGTAATAQGSHGRWQRFVRRLRKLAGRE